MVIAHDVFEVTDIVLLDAEDEGFHDVGLTVRIDGVVGDGEGEVSSVVVSKVTVKKYVPVALEY